MNKITTPTGAGLVTPESDEPLNRDESAQGFKGQTTTDTAIVPQSAYRRKRFASLQATAAMAGCQLHELASGNYLLVRWALTRELQTLDAVEAMLAQMGGAV